MIVLAIASLRLDVRARAEAQAHADAEDARQNEETARKEAVAVVTGYERRNWFVAPIIRLVLRRVAVSVGNVLQFGVP